MSETQLFKHYYGLSLAQTLADKITAIYPGFDTPSFIAQLASTLDELEFKGRIALISAALRDHLPSHYPDAVKILLAILGPEIAAEEGMFRNGWFVPPLAYFVEVYGLDYFDESIAALYEMTKRNTAEFAIRPFLAKYPQRTLAIMETWTQDENPHIRRLVSEGTRTRLPWASRLKMFIEDPSPVLKLLTRLKNDPSLYVRKSVANNLNDIAKDHPQLVLEILTDWHKDATPSTLWIIRHALRTRIKQGDPAALRLLGFESTSISLHELRIEPTSLQVGDTATFSFILKNDTTSAQNLMIDYQIHFVRANGKRNPKVFKLKSHQLPSSQSIQIQKKHSFKPITTRRYYSGLHRLEIQVNGQILGGVDFVILPT